MTKRLIFGLGMAVGLLAVTLGGFYAFAAHASDVAAPVITPDSNIARYHVVGTSMSPTIEDGDWLNVRESPAAVNRGDVIILRYPKDETKVYCRRVIGTQGDKAITKYYSNVKLTTIYSEANPNGVVFPSDTVPIGQPYGEFQTQIGVGEYYVVGDNVVPGGSYDSDEWGLLPVADIVGKVLSRSQPSPRLF
jgi:signal peptidase I